MARAPISRMDALAATAVMTGSFMVLLCEALVCAQLALLAAPCVALIDAQSVALDGAECTVLDAALCEALLQDSAECVVLDEALSTETPTNYVADEMARSRIAAGRA